MTQRYSVTELDIEPLKDGTGRSKLFIEATDPEGNSVKMVGGGNLFMIVHEDTGLGEQLSILMEFIPRPKETVYE